MVLYDFSQHNEICLSACNHKCCMQPSQATFGDFSITQFVYCNSGQHWC